MKRDNGIGLALGAAAALAAAALLSKKGAGSSSRSAQPDRGSFATKRPFTGVVTDRDRALGRQKRTVIRLLEAADSAPVSIEELSARTGLTEDDVISIVKPMTRGGGYYLEEIGGRLHAGQASWGMRELYSIVKRNIEKGTPEVGVRLVGTVQSVLPQTSSQEDFTLRSPRADILEDLRGALERDDLWKEFSLPKRQASAQGQRESQLQAIPQGELMALMAKVYLEALRERRILTMNKNPNFWLFGGIGRDGQQTDHVSMDAALHEWPAARYIPWMETVIQSGIKKKAGDAPTVFYELKSKFSYIMDWALTEGAILDGMSLDEAHAASEEWHNSNKEKASAVQIQDLKKRGEWYACPDGIHPIQSPVAVQLPGGWTWQELSTFDELAYEGNTREAPEAGEARSGTKTAYGRGCLQHCIGTMSGYLENAKKGVYKIYSLRTPANRPMQTMTVEMNKGKPTRIIQIAGLLNRPVASEGGGGQDRRLMKMFKEEGLSYQDFDEYLDHEAKMTEEALDKLKIPKDGPDYARVRSRTNKAKAGEF